MIFRQLFDAEHGSSTYTYLLADPVTKEAVLIDPVVELVRLLDGMLPKRFLLPDRVTFHCGPHLQVDRDLEIVNELGLNLIYGINTHCRRRVGILLLFDQYVQFVRFSNQSSHSLLRVHRSCRPHHWYRAAKGSYQIAHPVLDITQSF